MMAGTKTLVFVFVVASLFASGSLGKRLASRPLLPAFVYTVTAFALSDPTNHQQALDL
jgi:hypothetical protein